MRAYYSDHFVLPLPEGHRFPMAKYRQLRDRLMQAAWPRLRLCEAPEASEGELALVHTPAWIEAVAQGTTTPQQQREIGFPWSLAMAERARRSVGATVAAARSALMDGEGVAANLAGGTHHSYADHGSGYCVFNDVAVAARLMQAEWFRHHREPLQVLVIDLDVHQGNGTAAIFARDDSVFTLSLHGERNFPFRKERSDLDVELPDGCQDEAYLAALDRALDEVERRLPDRHPGLAFFLAGADTHEGDRLGRLKVSTEGMARRDQRVLSWLGERRIPAALSMAGGYGHDPATTVAVQVQTLHLAWQAQQDWVARQPVHP